VAVLVASFLAYRGLSWVRPQLVKLRRKPSGPSFFERLVPLLPRRGLGLGLATAIFPCGALLSGIVAAAATGSAPLGALAMFAFALGSAPLLMVPTIVGRKIPERLREGWGRKVAGVAMLGVAAWVVAVPAIALLSQPQKPSCCQHHHG
jgi:sulfite exporter TauE/SafE